VQGIHECDEGPMQGGVSIELLQILTYILAEYLFVDKALLSFVYYPLMTEKFLRRRPFDAIYHETLLDKILALGAYCLPDRASTHFELTFLDQCT